MSGRVVLRNVAVAVVASILSGLAACGPTESGSVGSDPSGHALASRTPSDQETPPDPDPFSGASAWRRVGRDASLVADLQSSCSDSAGQTDCVAGFMRDNGAREEAVEFYRRTQTFLVAFKESGGVDVGVVLDPWLANNNTRTVLLNGETPIFEPHSQEPPPGIRRDPDFQAAKTVFPDLDLGIQFPSFESKRGDKSRSGYIFQFYLEDGCHACGTGFMARVIFRFDEDDAYEGSDYLGICNANASADTPGELSGLADCPAPPRNLYPGLSQGPR